MPLLLKWPQKENRKSIMAEREPLHWTLCSAVAFLCRLMSCCVEDPMDTNQQGLISDRQLWETSCLLLLSDQHDRPCSSSTGLDCWKRLDLLFILTHTTEPACSGTLLLLYDRIRPISLIVISSLTVRGSVQGARPPNGFPLNYYAISANERFGQRRGRGSEQK